VPRLAQAAFTCAILAASGCSGRLDFQPSSVGRWSGPPFPAERVEVLHLLPVTDRRGLNRDGAVVTAMLIREAATSLLHEKNYDVIAVGESLALDSTRDSDVDPLAPKEVAERAPADSGFVLALAIEETEPDVVASPATVRVQIRGAITDMGAKTWLWSGESAAESGFVAGAVSASATASEYGAIYQAMRALLADVPARAKAAT
jgi:hypothetical protein